MNVTLYSNSSDNNVVDKTLTSIATKTVNMKEDCSLLNPSFILSANSLSELKNCNYMYVEDLGRYYYINNIQFMRGNIYQVDCHCDVLMSFKSQYRSKSAIIRRQQNNFNLYLNDQMYRVYNKERIQTKKFTGKNDLDKNLRILISVAGGN